MTTATNTPAKLAPFKMERGVKYRDAAKTSVIQVRNIDPDQELLKKTELDENLNCQQSSAKNR